MKDSTIIKEGTITNEEKTIEELIEIIEEVTIKTIIKINNLIK